MRQTRYIGLAKTHLQHIATAAALNVIRVINHIEQKPLWDAPDPLYWPGENPFTAHRHGSRPQRHSSDQSHKAETAVGCARPVILAWRKPIYSTSPRQPPSTSFE